MDCKAEGIIQEAEVTDHEIPKDICPDPWDQDNWKPRCKKHHQQKSSRDRKHFKNKK